MAGWPELVDFQKQNIAIAIDPGFDQALRVSGLFALSPDYSA